MGLLRVSSASGDRVKGALQLSSSETHLTEEHGELGPALVDLSSSQQSSPDVTAAGAVQQALDAGMTMDKTDAEALDVGSVDEACAEAHHVEVNEPFVAFASLNSDVASGLNPNLDLGTRQLDSDKREPAFADGQLGPDKGQPKVGDGQPNVSNQSVLPMLQLDVSDGLPVKQRDGGGLSPLRLCSQLLSHLSVQSPCLQSPGLQQPDSFQLQSAAATPRCASALLQLYPGLEQLSSDVTRDPRQLCLSLSCSSRQQPGVEQPDSLESQSIASRSSSVSSLLQLHPGLEQPDSFQCQSFVSFSRSVSSLLQLYPGLEQPHCCQTLPHADELTKTPSTRLQTYPGLERPGALQRQHQSESASRCQSGVLQSYPGLEQRYQHTETIVQSLSSVLQVSPGLEQPGRQKMQQSSGTSSAATLEPPLQQCSRLETAAVSKAQQALGDKADQPLQPPESVCSALSSQPDSMYPGLEPAAPSWAQYKQQQGSAHAASGAAPFRQTTDSVTEALSCAAERVASGANFLHPPQPHAGAAINSAAEAPSEAEQQQALLMGQDEVPRLVGSGTSLRRGKGTLVSHYAAALQTMLAQSLSPPPTPTWPQSGIVRGPLPLVTSLPQPPVTQVMSSSQQYSFLASEPPPILLTTQRKDAATSTKWLSERFAFTVGAQARRFGSSTSCQSCRPTLATTMSPTKQRNNQEFQANFGTAVRSLREDIPCTLQRSPNMDIFAANVSFTDNISSRMGHQTNVIQGHEAYSRQLWSLRFHAALLFSKSHVEMQRMWQRDDKTLAVRWSVLCSPRLIGGVTGSKVKGSLVQNLPL
ncbi:hypothetical protein WJX79_001623 [Trebouxia sp. C0005]